jgi:hypothetical protein
MADYVAGLASSLEIHGDSLAWLFESAREENWDALTASDGATGGRFSSTRGTVLSLLLAGAKEVRW